MSTSYQWFPLSLVSFPPQVLQGERLPFPEASTIVPHLPEIDQLIKLTQSCWADDHRYGYVLCALTPSSCQTRCYLCRCHRDCSSDQHPLSQSFPPLSLRERPPMSKVAEELRKILAVVRKRAKEERERAARARAAGQC